VRVFFARLGGGSRKALREKPGPRGKVLSGLRGCHPTTKNEDCAVERTRRPKTPQCPIVPEEQATAPAIGSFVASDAPDTFTATGKVPWPTRSIADAAKTVDKIPNNKIRPELVVVRFELVRQTLSEAARWADYYQSQQRNRRAIAKQRVTFARSMKTDIKKFRKTENRTVGLILALEEALAPTNHPLQPEEIKRTLQTLRALISRLERMREECSKSIPGIEGRPGDAWLLGYIWAMARGWKQLTTLPITPRGYFTRFLEQGFKLLRPDREAPDWESLIKTATQRFRLKSEKPLQPGNDLALFPVEKLTPDCE
jgi:hypothetical protein